MGKGIDRDTGQALFVLAPQRGGALVDLAVGDGWRPVIGTDSREPAADFVASGAAVALVDARDGLAAGLNAVGELAGIVAATGAALLGLVASRDPGAADALFAAGATHFLIDPGAAEIVAGLRFAARHAARAGAVAERRGAAAHRHDAETAGVRRWIGEALADERPVAVLLLALSRLDLVNAAHGRPAVDALIEAAARRIATAASATFGGQALVVRTGGAEFLVAAATDGAGVERLAGTVGEALARPFVADDALAVLGSRYGIAARQPGDDAMGLIRRASDALARARVGEGTVRVAQRTDVARLDLLAVHLHHAINRGEIELRFQPQVDIATGRIVGVEALARWDHQTLGPLGAEMLFAAATRADLGIVLSDHIQQLALARAAAWPDMLASLRLSVNLTAGDVTRPGFAALFLQRVERSGFPCERLTVEITETGLIEDLAAAAALLAELREAGCRIAIDDFGTGYSSLAYLKALPLDYLKIDKALVRDIEGAPRDRVVVEGVIDIARRLGLMVIAEGVETEAQAALLAAAGCGLYQGFLRAEPLEGPALIAMVEAERCE